jgi:hypothetical protein
MNQLKKMKQYFLLLFLTLSIAVFSQEEKEVDSESASTEKEFSKNEIKLNVAYVLIGHPEITYERFLSDESAIGLSAAFSIDKDVPFNYSGIAYYRFYFGKKPASGFFIEANGGVFSVRYEYHDYHTPEYQEIISRINDTGTGAGAALGVKFITKKGWVGEFVIGGLRTFMFDNKNNLSIYPRLGLTIGKKF